MSLGDVMLREPKHRRGQMLHIPTPVSTDRSPTHRDKEENRGGQGLREVGGEVLFNGDGFSLG